jgi:MazG family protein
MLPSVMSIDPETLPSDPLRRLEALMAVLRGPHGCPWDRQQDHRSLRRHLIEETCEVLDELDRRPLDPPKLAEELGDLLLQVAFHAQLARERADFDLNEIARLLNAKLVRRHPHVFGTASVAGAGQVLRNWHRAKQAEQHGSPPPDLPILLPALARAQRLAAQARRAGREPILEQEEVATAERAWQRFREQASESPDARSGAREPSEQAYSDLGHLLWVIAVAAETEGLDAEAALREAAARLWLQRDPPAAPEPER